LDYFTVRPSQTQFFKTVPFYYQSEEGEFLLYKKAGDMLDAERTENTRHPHLFISNKDKDTALKELTTGLNREFERLLRQGGGLLEIKQALGNIVREALTPGQETAMLALPETIDILFKNMDQDHTTMEYLAQMATASEFMVEHTVNVTALTLQYCFFKKMNEGETSVYALCALLHDVGVATLDKSLVNTTERLTEKQFQRYQAHAEAGHDMIILNTDFNIAVANVALEHHERLDKSGYPNGINTLCMESQLIGFIDCYEALTYRDKTFRKAKTPFKTLHLIKEEVIAGKFSPRLFKAFTSCLTR
tara:strand:+ start:841 stop:1755 length:915 start_codon:yes stop_codon:yes gene_type:complete